MAETSQLYADAVRARELYKYYKPPPSITVTSSRAESPDTILTSFAQLVAWRLGTQRAMVSLIDRETQYFVAESTKTLNLRDNQRFEDPAEALWVGCAAVGKEGRLCEKTIALPPVNNGFPLFEVPDLREDNRFNILPFVTGPPFLKFYAGTPLTTQRGVNIVGTFPASVEVHS